MTKIKDNLDFLALAIEDTEKWRKREQPTDGIFTDVSCRVNALHAALGKVNDEMKAQIKATLIEKDMTISEGYTFIATINRLLVKRLDLAKVKSFLGKRLPDYEVETPEVRLSYRPKP